MLGGSFTLFYGAEESGSLSYDVSAGDMQSEINNLSGVDGVTVSRYTHLDDPFSGYAWAVTFPATMGNVEALGLNDKHVTGVDIGLNNYNMFNMTTTAENDDIDGHFRIAIGAEFSIPLVHDATNAAVLNAIHKMTNVAKVFMINQRVRDTFHETVHIGLLCY